jgi:hypothetical protein
MEQFYSNDEKFECYGRSQLTETIIWYILRDETSCGAY